MSFNEKYNIIKQIADKELSLIENKMTGSISIREPLNSYILEFLLSPSKRVRSLLSILYLRACGFELTDKHVELLSAIELVHSASLIHDDIIDESNIRRGKQTVYSKFGSKLGVISGDYLLSVAMEKIAKLDSISILQKFSSTLKQMCIGEINQNFDRFKIGTIDDYIEKSKNKTAYLFETALYCTLLLSGEKYLTQASDFGLNTGIAFQIRDDLQNLLNNDNSKPANNDIKEGIYNAPVIYSQNISDYSSGIEKTKILLNNYIKQAKTGLNNLPENEYRSVLFSFLELLNNE